MNRVKYVVGFILLALSNQVFPQSIAVEPLSRGFFGSTPTFTMPYETSDAKLTIVVIMGYPGSFGVKAGDHFVRNTTARMMRDFAYRQKVKANIVILDSPFPLQDIAARSTGDHLSRIESVVRFYTEKFKVPVWLLGHSDGSISVAEYLNRSEETRRSIAGSILSGGRDETRVKEDWKVPTLVIHHEKDECQWTTFDGAKRYHAQIKEKNSMPTEFATVIGGFRSGPPCSTGFHMYDGAFEETLDLIEDFVNRHKSE